jgi:hypothetical protein
MGGGDFEYPFKHGEVINYTLDCASIHPVTTKKQASFLNHYETNGDFKTVTKTEFNGCDGGSTTL